MPQLSLHLWRLLTFIAYPTLSDVHLCRQFVELHGDRAGYDDPAIVTGLGTIDGRTYMFIGLQKGRNTKESLERNFAMPTPHGYVPQCVEFSHVKTNCYYVIPALFYKSIGFC